MNNIQLGFIKESQIIPLVARAGKAIAGVGRYLKGKIPKYSPRVKEGLKDPFKGTGPWKKMEPQDKARILSGIGMNVTFGAVPATAAAYYGGKKLFGKGPDYEKKYKGLLAKTQAQQQAQKIYYGQRSF
jgi:hypothetical protein